MKYLFLIGSLCFFYGYAHSQNPVFSQYYASGGFLNPALNGLTPTPSVQMNYRSQWKDVLNYSSSQVTVNYPFNFQATEDPLTTAGVSLYDEQQGSDAAYNRRGAWVSTSYRFYLNEQKDHTFVAGLQGGFEQFQITGKTLVWGSDLSQNPSGDYATDCNCTGTKIYGVLNAGFLWHYSPGKYLQKKNYFAGFSVANINQPDYSFLDEERKQRIYKFHGGFKNSLNEKLSFSSNFLFVNHNKFHQMNIGAYLSYRLQDFDDLLDGLLISVGGWYRVNDAAIISLALAKDNYRVGLSYDNNVSNLDFHTRLSSYEISFKYTLHHIKLNTFETPLM